MKKTAGNLPEPFDEEDEAEFRRRRRYFRKKLIRKKPKRWRKSTG